MLIALRVRWACRAQVGWGGYAWLVGWMSGGFCGLQKAGQKAGQKGCAGTRQAASCQYPHQSVRCCKEDGQRVIKQASSSSCVTAVVWLMQSVAAWKAATSTNERKTAP